MEIIGWLNFGGFVSLKDIPRDYFVLLIVVFFESLSYSTAHLIIIPYLSDLGYSDTQASWIFSCYGAVVTVVGVFGGFLIDRIGLRSALLSGMSLLTLSRMLMAFANHALVFVFTLLTIMPVGSALCFPSILTGVRRFTTSSTRAYGFSLFYITLSVSMLFGGVLTDIVRSYVPHHNYCPSIAGLIPPPPKVHYRELDMDPIRFLKGTSNFSDHHFDYTHIESSDHGEGTVSTHPLLQKAMPNMYFVEHPILPSTSPVSTPLQLVASVKSGLFNDAYRVILLIGAFCTACMLPLIYGRVGVVDSSLERGGGNAEENPAQNEINVADVDSAVSRMSLFDLIKGVCGVSSFWKLFVVVALLMGVFQVHKHLELTLPKYLMRTVGCDVEFGLLYAMNQIVVIICIPVTTILTSSMHLLDIIALGASVVSLSPFVFIASSSMSSAVVHVVILSVGQAFLNPRINEYSATIAPKGREGTYMALSNVPAFLGKVLTGFSGCPCHLSNCEPCCHSRRVLVINPKSVGEFGNAACPRGFVIWITIGVIALVSTMGLVLMLPWLKRSDVDIFAPDPSSMPLPFLREADLDFPSNEIRQMDDTDGDETSRLMSYRF